MSNLKTEISTDECMKLEADYNAFAGKLERVKRAGPSRPRSARNECSREERRRSIRAAWIEAFETRPSETARKILNGKPLVDACGLPEGAHKFWAKVFGAGEPEHDLRVLASRLEYTENAKLKWLGKPFSKEEIVLQLKKLKVKALGMDGINRDAVRAVKAKVWRNWLNRFVSTGYVPKTLREFRLTLIPKSVGASIQGTSDPSVSARLLESCTVAP